MDWAPSSPEGISPVLVAVARRAHEPPVDDLDGGSPVGRGSVDDIMAPDLDLQPIDQHFLHAKT